ncbi:MAG: RNA polymerase sigma factor [Bacteroidales bacterium]|nr:RNA polymerase sigma factor [Bacteroidales bacterium]
MFRKPDSRNYGFYLLVNKYQRKVYWHIRRMVFRHEDADDLTQETFIKTWKGLDKFRGDAKLYTWIYRIATNESLTFLKTQRMKAFFSLSANEYRLAADIQSDPYFSGDEVQKKLHQAILSLPPKQRLVFNMRYFEETPYEEMSDILGTSVGALKASYHLASKKIEAFVTSD